MLDKKMALKMSEMGVSADVILKLMLEDGDESAVPQEKKPESSEESKSETPKEGAKSEPSEDPVLKAIEHLTGMIAAQNIRRDYIDSQNETADDILAKVLINKGDVK